MEYFAVLERDGDAWVVTFPAVPEAVAGGPTREAAIRNAAEVLEIALLTYAKDGRPLPQEAGEAPAGERVRIALPASAAAKLAFMEAFHASGLTRVALAEKLGKAEGEVRRMLDYYHPTKLTTLEEGLRALGKRFVLTVKEAA